MRRRRPPTVQGILAPHIPAEIYRDGDRLVIVQALPPERPDWAGRFAALGLLLAAGVGTTGLLLMLLAALDVAARIAAGIALPGGATVTVAVRAFKRRK